MEINGDQFYFSNMLSGGLTRSFRATSCLWAPCWLPLLHMFFLSALKVFNWH